MFRLILVVDDDPAMRRAVKRELKGVEVIEAGSAGSAMLALETNDITCVVADFNLGEGDTGAQLLTVVRDRWPATARVMISGHPGAHMEDAIRDGLASAAVGKPWPKGELMTAVQRTISKRPSGPA